MIKNNEKLNESSQLSIGLKLDDSDPFQNSRTLSKILKSNVTYEQLQKLDNDT